MLIIKAFSLFAPLVGTSVMIIAVVVASTLVQNDIRTARGITSSYSRGELAGVAEAIRAFIFTTTADTVITTVDKAIPNVAAICYTPQTCRQEMGDAIAGDVNNSIRNNVMVAYGNTIPLFLQSVGASSPDFSNVQSSMSNLMFKGFEKGSDENSYVIINREGMAPEDYTLVMVKGDITESVPMLPPQGLRIRLPWKIHNLSDTLSDASGWAMDTANLYSTCYARTKCGDDKVMEIPASWTNGHDYRGDDRCATDRNTVINRIRSELSAKVSLADFDVTSLAVSLRDESITRPSRKECCTCCGDSMCASEYWIIYEGYVTINGIKADWSMKSKPGISPQLETNLSYRNYP